MRRRLLRFAGLSLAALWGRKDSSERPVPRLVVRLGIVGHVALPEGTAVRPLVIRILTRIREEVAAADASYRAAFHDSRAAGGAECRLISQLAAGADQLVATEACRLGFSLQCILPVELETYAQDLRRNPGVDTDPEAGLRKLAAAASAVLQLDGAVDAQTGDLTQLTYETSALTMLEHSDVLIALVRSGAESLPGGTQWLIDEGQRRGVPLIRVVLDAPEASSLTLGLPDRRAQESLDSPEWARRLIQSLALEPPSTRGSQDWFEQRFQSHVSVDEEAWALSRAASLAPQLQPWLETIRRNYFAYWRWAQSCANAYRDLYQGAYISISLLGLAAVGGALLGALNPFWGTAGKWVELGALTTLLLLWHRARTRHWREGWLGYRLLEQQIGHVAVLALLGRTPPALNSPALNEFRREGLWFDSYLRAGMREASLLTATFGTANVAAAGRVILSGLIERQIQYYEAAIEDYRRANERLEITAVVALGVTFITAALYLFVHYYAERAWHWPIAPFRQVALAAGLFFPAMAATLAAIRTQSEFVQLATRYKGMCAHLSALRERLSAALAAAQHSGTPLFSAQIARFAEEAVGSMLDEVSQWHSLLFTHEIER